MTFDEILATVDGNGNGTLPEGWGRDGRCLAVWLVLFCSTIWSRGCR